MKMPKTIKAKDIIKILEKHGFIAKSKMKGSHLTFSNGKVKVTVVFPLTSIGVFKKICRITDIPLEEFL